MNSLLVTTPPHPSHLCAASFHGFSHSSTNKSLNLFLRPGQSSFQHFLFLSSEFKSPRFIASCCLRSEQSSGSGSFVRGFEEQEKPSESDEAVTENERLHSEVGSPKIPSFVTPVAKFSLSDQAFFILAFIACTTSVAFTSLVFAAVPTLFAMRNAAISLSKLADTAREELPSTMAALRLSGMEISDLTLELSDLSQEIADGVSKSAQALQAAEAGIRQIGSMAHQQTISMIQERASLPIISLQPVVAGAARKTSRAVGRATKSFMNIISGREGTAEYDEDN